MFDLEKYYKQCATDETVDNRGIFEYLASFKRIVIWGASYTGSAVGKKLIEENLEFIYWDKRYKELAEVNGVKVIENFTGNFDPDETIVIYCIPNHVLMKRLLRELKANEYSNIVRGDIFYSGAICNLSRKTGLSAERCWRSLECRPVICERAKNIYLDHCKEKKPGERIDFQYSVFILTSKCNLRCMHCVQFINDYPAEKRINIPFDQIKRDIDIFMTTIDSVAVLSVMGGETFLHPDISKIVNEFAKHKNFAFLSLPTNGLAPIKPGQLEGITDKRIIIAFGYYLHIANERQKEIYHKNVELVKSFGITYTESQPLPTWVEPSRLTKTDMDINRITSKKQQCIMPPRNLQVRDGKIHVCDLSVALHGAGIADYPNDYLDLREDCTLEERRKKLREFIDRPFYYSCGHCFGTGQTVPSAVQGVINDDEEAK